MLMETFPPVEKNFVKYISDKGAISLLTATFT